MLRITLLVALLLVWFPCAAPSVTYDNKSLIINGQRRILISGSIHYPRSTPEMWPALIKKAKDGGLSVIQTYVFWSGHEPKQGSYYFEQNYDLVRFIKTVHEAGLYVHLRIGPYVCAEWNFGGFPVWLKYVPGIAFRTDNAPFEEAMQGFTTKIVEIMKTNMLFESQGGPIIMSQIENEYDLVEYKMGSPGKSYLKWAAKMAESLETGIPWVMCKGEDAPDPVINTCNGFYCQGFAPNSPSKPKIWTENWSGWFTTFGGRNPYRPVEDIAYAVALFVQAGGSFLNYYMYHGGTNFGRTAGGPFITTSYDYDAPIDEFGLIRQPKWGHLRELHLAIRQCEPVLVSSNPLVSSLGINQEAHVFNSKSRCSAFLSNNDPKHGLTVTFRNRSYELPAWSVSILPDCITEEFNTARVRVHSVLMKMKPVTFGIPSWQSLKEEIPTAGDSNVLPFDGSREQLNVTRDHTDYLWYMTTVVINYSDLKGKQNHSLILNSEGDIVHVYINGMYSGTGHGDARKPELIFLNNVILVPGTNNISLLSGSMGLANIGYQFEKKPKGIVGRIKLGGINGTTIDLSTYKWFYKVGLRGEALKLYSLRTKWPKPHISSPDQPLKWYKMSFNAPPGTDPVALDMISMSKGQIWINGYNIGRYCLAYSAEGSCTDKCPYAGEYNENKCRNCDHVSQRWYHVPRSWLKQTGNSLVVLEEMGGKPEGIAFATRSA